MGRARTLPQRRWDTEHDLTFVRPYYFIGLLGPAERRGGGTRIEAAVPVTFLIDKDDVYGWRVLFFFVGAGSRPVWAGISKIQNVIFECFIEN